MTSAERAYSISLPGAVVERLFEHARSEPKHEVCGLLGIGRDGEICDYPIRNVAAQPAISFYMAPREQLAAFNAMHAANETLFAIYHSHPDAPALPSAEDLRQAAYPGVIYLIVSLRDTELRAYHFDGEMFSPVELVEAGEQKNGS